MTKIIEKFGSLKFEIFTVLGGLIFINSFLFCDAFRGTSLQAENASQFGQFLSGYLGAIFGLISIVLLFATLRNQRESSSIEKFENHYFELIKLHRDNVEETGIQDRFGKRTFVTLLREFREILKIVKQANLSVGSNLGREQILNLSYLSFFYGVGPNSNRILKNSLLPVSLI